MQFIDTHCHLDFDEFKGDFQNHVYRANQLGIHGFVVPGITFKQSQTLLSFKQHNPGVYIAFGLHPYFMAEHQGGDFEQLKRLAIEHREQLVAIGECGIDASIADIEKQQALFVEHIKLANYLSLPLIVHHRQSHHLIMQAFKQVQPKWGGVIHAFSGSLQQAQAYIKLGFKLGVGGTITYERANKTKQALAQVPLDSLVLETDAPSMPLAGYQGQVNLPERLKAVFDCLVAIRSESEFEITEQVYASSCSLFKI
ncbi:TatD family hydrolase [Pseudoalteromonas phenolica]|uniref:TatD family hydrolase n=1 Tax=Pseudoalteromonas phenolica TaxID=161398 RepID=UPI00384E039F